MRHDYKIDIKENSVDEFRKVLRMAGVEAEKVLPGTNKDTVVCHVSLSKYELLFVQLTAKVERINKI